MRSNRHKNLDGKQTVLTPALIDLPVQIACPKIYGLGLINSTWICDTHGAQIRIDDPILV